MNVTIEYDENFDVIDLCLEFLKKSEFTHLRCGTSCHCKGDGVWTTNGFCGNEMCESMYGIRDAKFVKLEVKE